MIGRMTDAYAAGLVDGEGCISVQHHHGRIFYPRVDVGMSVKAMAVLLALQGRFHGKIRQTRPRSEKWEQSFCWVLFGRPLETFLRAIQPHLILKLEQASLALKLQTMIDGLPRMPNGSASWTKEASKHGRTVQLLMQELNRRGPPTTDRKTGWFARRVGEVWLTPQADMVSPHGWGEFSETWPRSGMMRSGTAYRLPVLAHPIFATESGSSPREKWSTPTKRDAESLKKVSRGAGSLAKGNQIIEPLAAQAARRYPTPTARDWRSGTGHTPRMGHTPQLPEVMGGQLNPPFVEWLMGLPLGWTDVSGSQD